MRGENTQWFPFTGLSCPFLLIPQECPYALEQALHRKKLCITFSLDDFYFWMLISQELTHGIVTNQ